MKYQKNISRRAIAQRMMGLLILVAVVFLVGGFGIGYAVKSHITAKQGKKTETRTSEQVAKDFTLYGAYDDKCFTQEVSLDWDAGDSDFTPLDVSMSDEEQEFVYYLCKGYSIDFTLIMAIISCESNYDPSVISSTNDYGLMQINEINHDDLTTILGVTDYLDPYQNIRAGCFTVRKLFEKYQDTNMVLMCYNMGETGASRLWENGVYATAYSEKVTQVQEQYTEEMGW
jgi:hypothetical protein